MSSLGVALPEEIKRNVELVVEYARIGPNGRIGERLILNDINNALDAIAEQDVVKMLQCYEALKGNK